MGVEAVVEAVVEGKRVLRARETTESGNARLKHACVNWPPGTTSQRFRL